jgi:hypothetical protein
VKSLDIGNRSLSPLKVKILDWRRDDEGRASPPDGVAIQGVVDDVLRRLPFRVLVVQTDNGAEFQSHFHWHLEALDIRLDFSPCAQVDSNASLGSVGSGSDT